MGLFGGGSGATGQLKKGIKYAKETYADTQGDFDPYMQAGTRALGQYEAQLGLGGQPAFDVTQLPGYQQSLEQGLEAVNVGAAGAGMLMSGSRLKGLQTAGQDVFGQYYQNYMDRISGLQGQGAQMTSTLGGYGQQSAGTVMGGYTALAEAEAAETGDQRKQMMDFMDSAASAYGGGTGGMPA